MSQTDKEFSTKSKNVELSFPVPWGTIVGKTWGDPCLLPVLLVHGLQDNAGSFDRLISMLPETFYYVCIDLPGHGKSSKIPEGIYLDFMLFVNAIRRVVLQLQWTEFYFIGHSLGGQLGLFYTALYGDEVKKLVLLDTLTPMTVSLNGFVKYYQEYNKKLIDLENKMLNRSPPNYTYQEALDRLINHRPYFITKDAAEALIKRSLKESRNGTYYFSTDQRLKFGVRTAVTDDQLLSVISKVECPVLLVITNKFLKYVESNKNIVYFLALELFKSKQNFEIVKVDGEHDVHNNQPEVVFPYVKRFLLQEKSSL